MDLTLSEDQEELRQSVRDFLAAKCPPALVRKVVETGEPERNLWKSMVELDWPALNISQKYGGMGLSQVEVAVVVEELGFVAAPGPYSMTATQLVPAIERGGSDEQKEQFLSAIGRGEMTGSLGVIDANNSKDTRTRAEENGGTWVLTGAKSKVMIAREGEGFHFAVIAEVSGGNDGARGMFLVPIEAVNVHEIRGLDASRTLAEVSFDNVEALALGVPGTFETEAGIARTLDDATLGIAAETVGVCRALFAMTLEYAKSRQQFGVAIGSFQAVKHKMADVHTCLERARALVNYAVAASVEDDPKRELAVAMAKAASDDCQRLTCQEAIQTFGGIGFTWEADVHLFVKRAKTCGALFGNAFEHRMRVAQLMGVARSS